MSTFVLIHGAWHGSWCWERLTPELERSGHRVITVDLPIEDPAALFEDYADVVVSVLDSDDCVVVGHSLAGHVLPWVARRAPVRRLVYLCALVPETGRSLAEQQRPGDMLNLAYLDGLQKVPGGTAWADFEVARSMLFGECSDEVAAAAFERLRMQSAAPMRQPFVGELPEVPVSYILCTGDRMVYPDWSRRVAGERLGVEVVEMPGDHSPFYSRPSALAEVLTRLA